MSDSAKSAVYFGGDYNPEQWPRDVWEQDLEKLKQAQINTLTLNVFSWTLLQPDENTYDFTMLDEIIHLACKKNFHIILATSTAALPAWMVQKYPELTRVSYAGMKKKFGGRHNHCPNSEVYKTYAPRLAAKLAERYSGIENIVAWHVCNEYGGVCYCDTCKKAFQKWLKEKYGTIEALNKAWNTNFWSHTYQSFDEIETPNALGDGMSNGSTVLAGHSLDYMHFNTDSIAKNFEAEKAEIRKYDSLRPVTTNLMGAYKELDYRRLAQNMDVISWDCYPSLDTPAYEVAMNHDLMRSLKDQKPFWLMEQTPSQQNWQPYNSLKRPGQLRTQTYQAMAHGADHLLFFQMRQSVNGCEKFHGAVISHANRTDTRVFKEVAQIGEELVMLKDRLQTASTPSKAALVFDWNSWWATDFASGPNQDLKYPAVLADFYQGFFTHGIDVDLVSLKQDLSQYDVIAMPLGYVLTDEEADILKAYVKEGKSLVLTPLSGMADETDNVYVGGYPGPLKEAAGLWVEETDSLLKDGSIAFDMGGKRVHGKLVCDILRLEGAQSLGEYQEEFYAGTPAFACNTFGKGKVYYLGTIPQEDAMDTLIEEYLFQGVQKLPEGVESTRRVKDGQVYHFVFNHTNSEKILPCTFSGMNILKNEPESVDRLEPFSVRILANDINSL